MHKEESTPDPNRVNLITKGLNVFSKYQEGLSELRKMNSSEKINLEEIVAVNLSKVMVIVIPQIA